MSNAIDFISAYNIIDARLRVMYDGKGSLSFSDLVRRCAETNATVGRYEDELLTYAKLRNAIVHNSTREQVIAEPNDQATAQILHIAKLLSDPPKLSSLKKPTPVSIQENRPLSEAIKCLAEKGFSNLPVAKGGRTIGFINNRRIVRSIGNAIQQGCDVDAFLKTPCGQIIREEDMRLYYKTLKDTDTLQDALDCFSQNKKLLAVIVSDSLGRMSFLLTPADLPELIQMLEE